MFAFSEYGYMKSRCNVPPVIATTVSLKKEIARLEQAIKSDPQNPENYFRLADIFYWDCLWIRASIELVERGLLLDPDNVPYRWLVTDMRYRFPSTQPNAEHFKQLLRVAPHNSDALYYYSRHQWRYEMDYRAAVRTLRKIPNANNKLYLLKFFIDNYCFRFC
jgi:cytochrome c-type biogenesis protein CcmH/NrfG